MAAAQQMGKACVYAPSVFLTFCMSSSSCSSSSLVMLYCCSSTSAKDSMARMDSLSFRVRTMSWNGERPTDQTLLEKHVQSCLLVAHGQLGFTSQFSAGWEVQTETKSGTHKPAPTNCEHGRTRDDVRFGGLAIFSHTTRISVCTYKTTNHSNASHFLRMALGITSSDCNCAITKFFCIIFTRGAALSTA